MSSQQTTTVGQEGAGQQATWEQERAVTHFIYREARLADESRYSEWEALWSDDAVYWVPADPYGQCDPASQVSHIYDNRKRIATRVRQLNTGYRYSQVPISPMRRVIGNIEVTALEDDHFSAFANFILSEQNEQSTHRLQTWAGQVAYGLRAEGGDLSQLRMHLKKVTLVNAAEPLPSLAFII